MQINAEDSDGAQHAPRSGAAEAVAPFLDKEGGNVPTTTVAERPRWSRKQWTTRRVVIDSLRYWQSAGYQCVWVTLTSSPTSSREQLRRHFQVLRKRISRELGFEGFQYVCVDTLEGHGVLHMIWAWRDPNPRKRASFYIPFQWLQSAWNEIHGAFHVNLKRVGNADKDARRLSRYLVAQYCGGQDGLVRLSRSRMDLPLSRMRETLLRTLQNLPERYEDAQRFLVAPLTPVDTGKLMNQWFWVQFREAWDWLVKRQTCQVFGVQFVWFCGALQRV